MKDCSSPSAELLRVEIAQRTRAGVITVGRRLTETEEPWPVPARAGDRPSDGREAREAPAVEVGSRVTDFNPVQRASILAGQSRTPRELVRRGRRRASQRRLAGVVQPTEKLGLEAPGNQPAQEIPRSKPRRGSPMETPQLAQFLQRHGLDAQDLGLDRRRLFVALEVHLILRRSPSRVDGPKAISARQEEVSHAHDGDQLIEIMSLLTWLAPPRRTA